MLYILLVLIILIVLFYFLNSINSKKFKQLKKEYELLKHNNEIVSTTFNEYNKIQNMSDNELNNMLDKLCKTAQKLDIDRARNNVNKH